MDTKHIITAEEFKKEDNKRHFMTVGMLREKIKDLPDDMPVMYQRIEDMYFDVGGWKTVELTWDFHEMSEYIPAWCAYKHDEDFFVIDAHY